MNVRDESDKKVLSENIDRLRSIRKDFALTFEQENAIAWAVATLILRDKQREAEKDS